MLTAVSVCVVLPSQGSVRVVATGDVEEIGTNGLDVVLSVGYRVKSPQGILFRRWANTVLKDYLLRGYAVNQRLTQLEDRVDRRLAKHEREIAELKEKVDFFVRTQTPPLQGVFYDGQLWDACSLVEKLVARANRTFFGELSTTVNGNSAMFPCTPEGFSVGSPRSRRSRHRGYGTTNEGTPPGFHVRGVSLCPWRRTWNPDGVQNHFLRYPR